jgi:EAL domain-containing protein (putative c-di-GMP-specific phosphodiesterase class I)
MAGKLQKPLRVETLRTALREIYDAAGVLAVQDLSKALIDHEFRLAYQPQLDLKSGAVIRLEALARWDHSTRGPIPPATFIPVMEPHGIMNDFTLRVLDMALDDMRKWDGATNVGIAINVSAANCVRAGIDELIRAKCIEKGVDIRRLTIEITETAAMAQADQVTASLGRLCEYGAQLSIDDFGTGYSSLVQLHHLPFSELKIDKSFVVDCVSNQESSVLVRAMIDLAHNLNKRVVAEGVESRETLRSLREWGCDIAQGYFIGRPMPPALVPAWLELNGSPPGPT